MRLAILVLYFALVSAAYAQSPQIVDPGDRIELGIGESKTFRFPQPFKSFDTATPNIVKFLPQSDRQLTITGVDLGQTLMFIHDDRDQVIYTATVSVLPGAGRLVKIYGHRNKDFRGYYCSETGCGRADLEKRLANGRDPDDPIATTVTQPLPGGGAVTRQYGPN